MPDLVGLHEVEAGRFRRLRGGAAAAPVIERQDDSDTHQDVFLPEMNRRWPPWQSIDSPSLPCPPDTVMAGVDPTIQPAAFTRDSAARAKLVRDGEKATSSASAPLYARVSGQPPSLSGRKACSAGVVCSSL
ncbi:hypothetical protein GCM10011504_32820 [Siccirubricoccus deserti]|nr:hypothetical protein GCM10011504_32820 [Siccirubricoccus deserti]